MKKPTPRKPAPSTENPFPRRPVKIPAPVQDAAGLWLDLFTDFARELMDKDASQPTCVRALDDARELADRALEIYQTRWPGVRP